MGLQAEAGEQREVELASVEVVELGGSLVESDNGGLQVCLAFGFLVSCINAVKIGVSEFPGKV